MEPVDQTSPAPLAVSVEMATHMIPAQKTTLYKLIKEGKLRSFLCGRRRMIPVSEIEAFIERSMTDQNPPAGTRSPGSER
jgi:excisionase family DNA binding protein